MNNLDEFEVIMSEHGFVLYANPSFFEGMSRLIDFGGLLNSYNLSKTPEEADFKATLSDWEAVGFDLLLAERKFNREFKPVIIDEKEA